MVHNIWYNEMLNEWKDLENTAKRLKSSWDMFMHDEELYNGDIKPEVLSSWKRCRSRGLSPYKENKTGITGEEVEKRLLSAEEMLEVTEPILLDMASTIEDTGLRFDVYSSDMYLIKRVSSGRPTTPKKDIPIGYSMKGQDAGTNAVCLAKLLERPVQLSSYEHYNVHNHEFTSAAVPIMALDGRLGLIISLDNKSWPVHKHTLSMLIGIKINIEERMHQNYSGSKNRLSAAIEDGILKTMERACVIVNSDKTIYKMNEKAVKLLSDGGETLEGRLCDNIWGEREPFSGVLKSGKALMNAVVSFELDSVVRNVVGDIKPIKDAQKTVAVIGYFEEKTQSSPEDKGGTKWKARYTFDFLTTQNENMLKTIEIAKETAKMGSNVLIQGETGTGKEIFAQSIHNESLYKDGPFVVVNCSAIPSGLLESELFGYEEGAFTGAKKGGSIGKFELASGGTIFLDEINSMSLDMQAKILRVLQDKTIVRVGGADEIPINARVISATNANLWDMVKDRLFREDLFYRINVITVDIPPLRKRPEDIEPFIELNLEKFKNEIHQNITMERNAVEKLKEYDFPGNVRELQNIIERCIVTARIRGDNVITTEIINNSGVFKQPESAVTSNNLKALEKKQIENLLNEFGWNIKRTAEELSISRNTLYRKIKTYGILKK